MYAAGDQAGRCWIAATASAARSLAAASAALCLLIPLWAPAVQAADDTRASPGRPISAVVDAWREQGVPFAYSTELIDDSMVVLAEPDASDPEEIVAAILAPYGLRLYRIEGLLVVGRTDNEPVGGERSQVPQRPAIPPAAAVPELTVSASRYEILRDILEAPSYISQRTIRQLPLLGEDPLRSVQRLPGNASSGASARSHLRGSAERDTGLILNGQRLLDPFHVRDYQNLFSAIDSRAISGVEVYTGGFPAKYGNGIGGLVLIDTVTPDTDRHTEIGLSVYNTSFLSAGRASDGEIEWLLSARRGNLDLVLNDELGEPSYNDVFAEIAFNPSVATRLSVNALVANDNVIAVTETDPEEREASENDTRNAQFWLNWRQDWSESLSSYASVSLSSLNVSRMGSADDAEEIIASVDDRREIDVLGLQQDWTWQLNDDHRIAWGGTLKHVQGNFRYRGSVHYFGDFAALRDVPESIARRVDRQVDGETMGFYLSDRWRLGDATVAELGFRWDKQTYTDTNDEVQFSPRFSLLHRAGEKTDLRFSIGRYFQAQHINELQVSDGVTQFFPAERADQVIVGVEQRLGKSFAWRAEAYYKDMHRLRPYYENMLDPLAIMPELKPDRVRVSAPDARARGIELSIGNEAGEEIHWWLSYTLASVEDQVAGRYVPRSWDQRHAGQVGLLWQQGAWEMSAVVSAHSGWPRTSVRVVPGSDPAEPELEFTTRNEGNYSMFATLDLRIAYRTSLPRGEMSFFFELSNATNRRNSCCVDFEIEDESGSPVLLQRNEYWFPLLPAIGLLWEF